MRGHIETRPNGRRYPIAELGRDPDTGKRVRKSMGGFKRYKDADRALRDALAKADAGKNPFPDDVLFRSYAESVIASRELHGRLRETTASRYRSLLRLYVLPSLGTMKLRDIRPTHVRLVIDGMQQRGQSPRSITQARAVVSMILKQAVADELLDANPCAAVSRPKAKNPNKRFRMAHRCMCSSMPRRIPRMRCHCCSRLRPACVEVKCSDFNGQTLI
jgi:integrase